MASRDSGRRFHFLREIASGGFGSVYLAKVMHADGFSRLVAVKLLKEQWADTDEVAKRTRDEAKLLGLLRHRNIVDVIDRTSIEGRVAILMEYIEAVDLRDLIEHHRRHHLEVPLRPALEILHFAAGALDAAYNRPPAPGEKPLRVIHRDIKPSNIMVDGTGLVKVLDFGVARSDLEDREGRTQELQFGSVDYMSPERLFFEPDAPAGDVYSMAATLFEVLALDMFGKAKGRRELHQAHVDERLQHLAELRGWGGQPALSEVATLLSNGLAYDAHRRPSASEFAAACRGIARKLPGDDLVVWAERELPELIRQLHEAPRAKSSLDDSVLTEDSIVVRRPVAMPGPVDIAPVRAARTFDEPAPETVIPEMSQPPVDGGLDEVPVPAPPEARAPALRPTLTAYEAERPVVATAPGSPTGSGRATGLSPWVALAGGLALLLGLLAVVLVVAVAVGIDTVTGPQAPADPPEEPVRPPPTSQAEVLVRSADPHTKRLLVRCTGEEAEGTTEAGLTKAGAGLGRCTVTAFLADRERRSAVLTEPPAGSWTCFDQSEDTCHATP